MATEANRTKENQSQDGVVEWPSGMSWRRGGMPPLNQRVLAYCEGAQYHSGASWFRNGYAFMIHHNCNTVGPGWGRSFYDDACRQLGADELTVIAWMPLEKPEWATR